MENNTLFVHAGGGKTGTSALQNFFLRNSTQLTQDHCSYISFSPNGSANDVSSGNGESFANAIASGANYDDFEKLILRYFDERSSALISSEMIGLPHECAVGSWNTIKKVCDHLGKRVRVIYFVRDPVSYFYSSYNQLVKRHGLSIDEAAYVDVYSWDHVRALRMLDESDVRDCLTVLKYSESGRFRMMDDFVSAIGLNPSVYRALDSRNVVNRSLDAVELEVVRKLNCNLGAGFSIDIADSILGRIPKGRIPIRRNPELEKAVFEKCKSDLDWLTQRCLNEDESRAWLAPNLSDDFESVGSNLDEAIRVRAEVQEILLDWLSRKMEILSRQSEVRFVDGLENLTIDKSLAAHPDIPYDFDPLVYLMIHRDVYEAGMNPFDHFIRHGLQEGRVYKFLRHL